MKTFALNRPWLLGIATGILFLTGWQLTPTMGLIDAQLVPPATTVLNRFLQQWLDPTFYPDLLITVLRVAGGFLLAAAVAIPLGLAMGYWQSVHRMFGLTIETIRPVPASALVPIAAAMFGIGNLMHISVVFLATVVPILLASLDGVRNVDPILISTARTFKRTTPDIFRTVLLPAALPHIVTGLRISIAIALVVGISSEMIMSAEGLGRRVVYAQRMLRVPELYAGVITLALLGYGFNRTFLLLENRILGWHRQAMAKNW
ncbi:ABC transporter permease [Roseiarcaceae bacterium H3SJ34-1]|uniref:ABC transporter permease n=1 Tax=Terripilifer ovatus TaxID=3032367 RepID=UPI003AB991E1|nr:ABC transporter permease [Roseiarcaceae bacterium H3SJ34-1]